MARKYRRTTTKTSKQKKVSTPAKATTPIAEHKTYRTTDSSMLVDKHAYVKSDLRRIGIISGAILMGYAVLYILNQSQGWI